MVTALLVAALAVSVALVLVASPRTSSESAYPPMHPVGWLGFFGLWISLVVLAQRVLS